MLEAENWLKKCSLAAALTNGNMTVQQDILTLMRLDVAEREESFELALDRLKSTSKPSNLLRFSSQEQNTAILLMHQSEL